MDRSEEFFTYLNSLDDDYYFFLANTVLGKIPSPFHKPVLNQKILSFMLNEENRSNLLAALDNDDRRYLSLILLTGRTSAKLVSRFFSSDSFILLVRKLSNLRDRLILLKEENRFRINPVLLDIAEKAFDADLLFGKGRKSFQTGAFVDRNILFAVTNLMISGQAPVREANMHHFIKSGKLLAVFPQFSERSSITFFSALKKYLLSSGALSIGDGRFLPDRDRMQSILELDPLNLMIQAIGPELGDPIVRSLDALRCRSMDIRRFSTLIQILSDADEEQTNNILDLIECFGFIKIVGSSVYFNQSVMEPVQERSELRTDSDMKVSFIGNQDPNDILYLFADIEVCDKLISYAISKDSFFRALELGLTRSRIESFLGLGEQPRFLQWENSFSRLRLYDGILVRCDSDIKTMIERHPDLKDHIVESFGDNLLLMKRSTYALWQQTLSYALDLKHLPVVLDKGDSSQEKSGQDESFTPFEFMEQERSVTSEKARSWEDVSKELLDYAESCGCNLSEIEPLISDRIIVSKSQIDKNFRYAGRISVSGFDYNAKLSAIKGALPKAKNKEADLLELELPSENLIVQPLEIVRTGQTASVLRSKVMPDGQERSISISSIFKVTVLRWSLK